MNQSASVHLQTQMPLISMHCGINYHLKTSIVTNKLEVCVDNCICTPIKKIVFLISITYIVFLIVLVNFI